MKLFEFATSEEAYIKMFRMAMEDHPDVIEFKKGSVGYTYDAVIRIEDASQFSLSIEDGGYTKSRWTRYLNEYLDSDDYWHFLETLIGDQTGMDIVSYQTPRVGRHRYGNCFLSLTARIEERDPKLIMHSRVCQWYPIGSLEMHTLRLTVSEILKHTGKLLPVEWRIDQMQHAFLFSMPLAIRLGWYEENLDTWFARRMREDFEKQIASKDSLEDISYMRVRRLATNIYKAFDDVKDGQAFLRGEGFIPDRVPAPKERKQRKQPASIGAGRKAAITKWREAPSVTVNVSVDSSMLENIVVPKTTIVGV